MSNLMMVRIKEEAENSGYRPTNLFTGEEVEEKKEKVKKEEEKREE